MIEVVDAIEFKGFMEGGSTRPWLVTVLQNGEPVPYVVKLYKTEHNNQNNTVLNSTLLPYFNKALKAGLAAGKGRDHTSSYIPLPLNLRLYDG